MKEFPAITANGATDAQVFVPSEVDSAHGKVTSALFGKTYPATVRMAGVWGGATATLQVRPPDLTGEGDWISLTDDTASTADAVLTLGLCAGWSVRVFVAGATGTTNLNVRVY